MKWCLMSNVNIPVPQAQGHNSRGLHGIWWHFNGLFIPEMPFPLQEMSEMGQQNLVGGKCDKAWFFMVRLVAVKE